MIKTIDRNQSGATTLARADLKVIAMKGYSVFLKAPASLEPHHLIVITRTLVVEESYLSAEMQSMYSTAPGMWSSKVQIFVQFCAFLLYLLSS